MSTEDHRRNNDDNTIDRRVDRLDSKIERVGDQVENVGKEMRTALEMLIKQQDERWKWFEQRSDMGARNTDQSIELLTGTVVKMEQKSSSMETQVEMLSTDIQVLSTKTAEQKLLTDSLHTELLRRIEASSDSLKWVTRTLAASLLSGALALIIALLTQ